MACNLFWALNISENMMKIMCLCANPEWGQKEIHGSPSWAIIRHSDRRNVLLGSGHFQAYPSCNKRKEKPHLPWDAHGVQPDRWSPTFTFLLVHSPVLPTLFLVRRDHSVRLKFFTWQSFITSLPCPRPATNGDTDLLRWHSSSQEAYSLERVLESL